MTSEPTLAIRPPEYFPRLEVAALFVVAERVVLADTFAFSRQAAHNRTRIVTSQGPQWLTAPRRSGPVGLPMREVVLVDDGWARRHRQAIRTAYGMAPFYDHYADGVAALLAADYATVGALAAATTRWMAATLGAPEPRLASELAGAPATLAGVWRAAGGGTLLTLAESADGDAAQLAPAGGRVQSRALDAAATYRQTFPGWVAGASSLDLLMNLGPEAAAWLRAALGATSAPASRQAPAPTGAAGARAAAEGGGRGAAPP